MARILVVGVGGIGGNVAAGLATHDRELVTEVVGLSTNPEIAAAVNARGLVLFDRGEERKLPGRVIGEVGGQKYDWILLCTQPPQVEAAARDALPALADGGAMVVLQNGLCEERVAAIAGRERTIGAVVGWGASMRAPGVYERTSDGGFVIGRTDGVADRRLDELALLLEVIGPVTITKNLGGARWSKLIINCGISTLGTIGGDRLGALMKYPWARRLGLEVVTEAVAVAKAEGIVLEKVIGTVDLDWMALTPTERTSRAGIGLVAKHSLMWAVGARYRNLRSSMLAAIERGRVPAVDFLNGEISERGRKHGIATPVNDSAIQWVHEIARKERRSGVETLRALFELHAPLRA
jgi:2-dehydropantoate 2-reductase